MKIKNIISNYTIFHPRLFHLPLRLSEGSGFLWKDSGQTRTTFIQNTYMFFQKVVRVLDERSSCFFDSDF